MNPQNPKIPNREELKEALQKFLDTSFKCPKCQSQNNITEIQDFTECPCAPGCKVLFASVAGQCNKCGHNFSGVLEVGSPVFNSTGNPTDDIKHAIEDRRMRHSLN